MINSGTVDIHIDPYTHTNNYSNEPVVTECYSYCFTICYKYPRWDLMAFPWINNLLTMPVTSLPVFVLFSRSRIPASLWSNHTLSGQTMMDTVTPRGPDEYLSIDGGANPNLELPSSLAYFSVNPKVAVIATLLQMTFNKPQSSWSKYEGTRYSHGLRNYANA